MRPKTSLGCVRKQDSLLTLIYIRKSVHTIDSQVGGKEKWFHLRFYISDGHCLYGPLSVQAIPIRTTLPNTN